MWKQRLAKRFENRLYPAGDQRDKVRHEYWAAAGNG